jgi:hypothetical protein
MAYLIDSTQALTGVFEAQRLIREPRPLPLNRVNPLRAHSGRSYPCVADFLPESRLPREQPPDEIFYAHNACASCCLPLEMFYHNDCEKG